MPNELPLETDCQTVHTKLTRDDRFLLIDCREPEEFEQAQIAGAKLIPMSQLAARVDELSSFRDWEIAVHCHHGGRSMRVTNWLREQGFPKTQSMAGGIDRWSLEIDPTIPRY